MECEKDYSNGLIYTIRTDDGLYVGSTCDFKDRKYQHKSSIYNENCHNYNLKLYKNIRQNGGEYRIELYKPFPCNSKRELEQEEERIRIELDANLNVRRAYLTEEEIENYDKNYREKNREELNAKTKIFRENNKDKLCVKSKLYYENNRDRICARMGETVICECGCKSIRSGISRHRKTKKHLNRMKVLDDFN